MNSVHPLQALLDEYKRVHAKLKDIEVGIAALRRIYPEFTDDPVIDHLQENSPERPKSDDLLETVKFLEAKRGTPIRIKDIEDFNPRIKSVSFRLKRYVDNGELTILRVNNSNMYTYFTSQHKEWLHKVNGEYQFRQGHLPDELKRITIKKIIIDGSK